MATTASVGKLDTQWTSLIESTMAVERKPLTRLTTQKDSIEVQKAIYTDLKSQLDNLQTQVKTMVSDDSTYALDLGQKATVSGVDSGTTVLTATASDAAHPGTYKIDVTTLAKEHRVASTRQTSSNEALGYNGTMTIQGVDISVDSGDSLNAIAELINSASYEEGKEVSATVVDNQLVLTAKNSGVENAISASGTLLQNLGVLSSEGGFANELTAATDAVIKVNGLTVTRSRNEDINDVIDGITLNLAADAEGESATLTVATDAATGRKTIENFIASFNTLQNYLTQKTGSTKVSDTEYTRGALGRDTSVISLRSDLVAQFNGRIKNSGIYSRLSDIGLTIDDKFQISISDSSKLNAAHKNNLSDVTVLLNARMESMDSLLSKYTCSSGIIDRSSKAIDEQADTVGKKIENMNKKLTAREEALRQQYADIQTQMTSLSYMQQEMSLFASYSISLYS